MEILILNTNLEAVAVLDNFESRIWTERYCAYGDFEIYTKASDELLNLLREDYYVFSTDSNYVMIIESREVNTDIEDGNNVIITGRSLESILDRRIVWQQTILTGNLQNGIKKLLDDNLISPALDDRAIPNFIFELSDDPDITNLTVDAQFTRTNLYSTIQKLCMANNIGFKVTLSDDNKFVFKLYSGKDRSYDQIANPYVVFSPNFENISNTNYLESKKALKTVTVVAGEGEGTDRKTTIVGSGSSLSRRELYTDARDLAQTMDGVTLTDQEYLALLVQRGKENLSEHIVMKSFEGQADTTSLFKYGEDFFMGDIVQIASEYGMESKARVTELVRSESTKGIEVYPTLSMIDVSEFQSDGVLSPGSGISPSKDTPQELLDKLKTVDGAGSGLESDKSISLSFRDTRGSNFNGFDYTGASVHLKTNTTDGLNDGGTYHGILHLTQWGDISGGRAHQLGFTDNENIWHRSWTGSAWSAFKKIITDAVYTAADVLAKLKTVDGTNSGLDADLLDGLHSTSFARSGYGLGDHLVNVQITDCDAATITGMYFATSVATGRPPGVVDGSLFVNAHSTNWVNQLFMDWRTNETYRRARTNGTWSVWKRLIGENEIKALSNQFSWGTTAMYSSGWYKIRIKPKVDWMLFFKLSVYQSYEFFEANISGYWYGVNHWFLPKAMMVSKTTGTTIHFGHEADDTLWIAFPASNYAGISITNIVNGYIQITEPWKDVFEVIYEASLTGTIQTTYNI